LLNSKKIGNITTKYQVNIIIEGPAMQNWWDWDESDAPEPYLPREWLDPEQWGERESGTGGFGDD